MDSGRGLSDEEYSHIGDKGDIGFIDFEDCKSLCSYNPSQESQIVNISVPFPLSNGKPRSGVVGETMFDSITLKNTTGEPLDLWSVSIYDAKPENSFTLSIMKPPASDDDVQYIQAFMEAVTLEDRVLNADWDLTIWLSCKPKEIGLHTAAVHFSVGDEVIERLVVLLAEDKISQSLTSLKPYRRSTRRKQNVVDVHAENPNYVAGRRPSRESNRGQSRRHHLPLYPIPANIRTLLNNREFPKTVNEGLTMNNYSSFFKNLIVMEEIKREEDMRMYDMECVSMKRCKRNNLLSLEVPGLAEKRPSLLISDFIFVMSFSKDETSNTPHQGFIHRVEAEEIHLQFEPRFQRSHRDSNLYNVQFTYNRKNMRLLYQSVEAAEHLDMDFLFPSKSFKTRGVQRRKLSPISCNLNEKQQTAVEMIYACTGGPPYLIHGPPGTGKTMTLIEAILQVYSGKRNARMLICAPSNSAADHILDRLLCQESIPLNNSEIFRLNAHTRPFEDVNRKHLEFCCHEDYLFGCPSLNELLRYRIVVSTYSSTSQLYSEGLKKGHFMYIFLDEAGQASEPETMVPLSHLYGRNTIVVLAGDPMQLGPVVFSRDAERFGLGSSYLERLFDCELYRDGNENFMTKLVNNYRTHEAILQLPSELFYQGELIACKEKNTRFSSSWEDIIPNKDFPLLFIGIQGCDEREGSNPSWFNRIEASKTVEMIKVLIEKKELKEEDIGVITPYKQQVNKIRDALGHLDMPNIKVGTVEQFQGQEREVIIVSTVRSTVKHNEFDKAHYLGFLSNPRRFNVAATRAKSLLIVIGNPHIICKDTNWSKLLWYCEENGSYKGCFLPAQTENMYTPEAENNFQPGGDCYEQGNGWKPCEEQCGGGNWDEQAAEQWGGGNWDEGEGDAWKPSEDKWEVNLGGEESTEDQCGGNWNKEVEACQPNEDQCGAEEHRNQEAYTANIESTEDQCGGNWNKEVEACQPNKDQCGAEEHRNQEAYTANINNHFQPTDIPWE
ncbi:hypothetical protein ACS0TY_027463 [Phlomoides rotata]